MLVLMTLVVCLAAQPDCKGEEITLGRMDTASCFIRGQEAAAKWINDNPKFVLKGWRCQLGERAKAKQI